MDPYLHTVIAVGCIFVAYQVGLWYGEKRAELDIWGIFLHAFDAEKIIVTDDEVRVTDYDGNERVVN